HGPAGGTFQLPRGKGPVDARSRRAGGNRPELLLRLLGLGVRSADAALRGPRGRGEPRSGSAADRRRGRLGGAPPRSPRPPPEGVRRDWRRDGAGLARAGRARAQLRARTPRTLSAGGA